MNGNVLFEIKDLQKKFGSLTVFDGLNETICKGDVVVIIGPSGGGKSTFIRCLNLLEQPTAGKIYFEGEDITAKGFDVNKHRQKVGMVFQQFNLFNNLTVLENITISLTKVKKQSEFKSIGLGGLYLSKLDSAIITSCGTGTALVYAKAGEEPKYLGGTGVGGGTLVGLSKKLLSMDNVEHISNLAKTGSTEKVDLKIKDITKADIVPGFGDIMTASNFGLMDDRATKADIALGIINMVFETIGMVSIFAARNYKTRDVVLTGNLSGVSQAPAIFETLNRMFDMNFIIPENSRFGTVIGAALAGIE